MIQSLTIGLAGRLLISSVHFLPGRMSATPQLQLVDMMAPAPSFP
jgi:hypothetical protein